MKVTEERKVLSKTEVEGNVIEYIQTKIETSEGEGTEFIYGYVAINNEPQYDFEQYEAKTGVVLQRTCGYGKGCFWTEWQ